MKVERTEITNRLGSHVSVIWRDEPFFQAPFHSHPELELVYIVESCGKRIIGNAVEPFEAGDMVFLGSDLPHVWLNDELYYATGSRKRAKAIVVYFNKAIFSPFFYEMRETGRISTLFNNAARGLRIEGNTHAIAVEKLHQLLKKKDFDILVGLFEILSLLSSSKDVQFINSEVYRHDAAAVKNDRLTAVYQYVASHYREDISLNDVAKIAHLTAPSFCRLFRAKTRKHFVEYLNEVRVSNACKLLIESDKSISETAYECGYKTVSNFNRFFKKITGLTPGAYKKKAGADFVQGKY